MEAIRILRQYIFSLIVILCLGAFCIGTVTVKEKTQYNMDMTPYKTVSVEKQQDGITLYYGEKQIEIRNDYAERISKALSEGFVFDFRHIFG